MNDRNRIRGTSVEDEKEEEEEDDDEWRGTNTKLAYIETIWSYMSDVPTNWQSAINNNNMTKKENRENVTLHSTTTLIRQTTITY